MEFTAEEERGISERSRERIEQAIHVVVEWSFGVRPMVQRTAAEEKRREQICLDFWRRQVQQGTEVRVAAENLPTLLISAIDHEDGGRVSSILEPSFASGFYPSAKDQQRIVQPELALSAFAKLKG